MSKLSNNLQKNEQVVIEGQVHWIALVAPGLLAILAFLIFVEDLPMVGLVIAVIIIAPKLIPLLTTEISLSNKRLVGKYGFINSRQMDSPLNKINSVSVENGLFGKIFGYGTLTVNTASTVYTFKNIKQVENFKHVLMEEMERYDEARVREQAEAIAGAIKQ